MLAIELPQNSHILPEYPKFAASSYITNFVNSFISEESRIREAEFKVQHYDYTAFGKLARIMDGNGNDVTQSPVVEPYFTYTGREYDRESGLYYFRARYYDSSVGRFLQVDPDSGNKKFPTSINHKYIYVSNNPIIFRDPSGSKVELKFSVGKFKFASSWKSILVGVLCPAATLPKLFMKSKDSDRYDSIVITIAVVTAAAIISPEAAAAAAISTTVQNVGRKGQSIDSLDGYTLDFAISFGLNVAVGADEVNYLEETGKAAALRLGFDAMERTWGKDAVTMTKFYLFTTVLLPEIGANVGSSVRNQVGW